jgi:hypothetical protein
MSAKPRKSKKTAPSEDQRLDATPERLIPSPEERDSG